MAAITGGASNILSFSASLSGRAVIPSTTTTDISFGVLYSTSSGVLINTAIKIEAQSFDSNYNFTITADNLSAETTYYYRSYLSMGGTITYGEVKNFTTLALPKPQSVDLGLSVKWASFNIGASKPEEYGRYFAWGDVVGQTWDGSSWSGGGFYTYPSYQLDANNNLKPEYDAAHAILGGKWRMPTKAECEELINNCTSNWTNINGVSGILFTSKKSGYTDKSIFLPAAGVGYCSNVDAAGSDGLYWSSTFFSGDYAWYLYFDSDYVSTYLYSRYIGRSVRPVSE